jgi:hypothetical protein
MHMHIFHRGLMATMIADLSASFRYEGLPILRWVPLSSSPQLSGSELPVLGRLAGWQALGAGEPGLRSR